MVVPVKVIIPLPPPQPSLAIRAVTCTSFAITALALAPFFLVGMLFRILGHPLVSLYERWHRPKPKKRQAAAKPKPGEGCPPPMPGSRTVSRTASLKSVHMQSAG